MQQTVNSTSHPIFGNISTKCNFYGKIWAIVIFLCSKKDWFFFKNTAKLYGDALVWTVVFIDWLDLFELVY